MDKEIKDIVKCCRCYAMVVKVQPVIINPWPKTDGPWSRVYIDDVVPMYEIYYLIVVDRSPTFGHFVKLCKSTNFLHEIFTRFGISDTSVSDNGTQFMFKEFGDFCKEFFISHVITVPFCPRSNGQVEHFINPFK